MITKEIVFPDGSVYKQCVYIDPPAYKIYDTFQPHCAALVVYMAVDGQKRYRCKHENEGEGNVSN